MWYDDKLRVPGRPANLDNSRAVGVGWVVLDIFFSRLLFLSSFSLWPDVD